MILKCLQHHRWQRILYDIWKNIGIFFVEVYFADIAMSISIADELRLIARVKFSDNGAEIYSVDETIIHQNLQSGLSPG